MILDLILGVNIDTENFIELLQKENSAHIAVIDYEYYDIPIYKNDILYLSVYDAKKYMKMFDSINFFKSLYAYPGMIGNMSTLFNPKHL